MGQSKYTSCSQSQQTVDTAHRILQSMLLQCSLSLSAEQVRMRQLQSNLIVMTEDYVQGKRRRFLLTAANEANRLSNATFGKAMLGTIG